MVLVLISNVHSRRLVLLSFLYLVTTRNRQFLFIYLFCQLKRNSRHATVPNHFLCCNGLLFRILFDECFEFFRIRINL